MVTQFVDLETICPVLSSAKSSSPCLPPAPTQPTRRVSQPTQRVVSFVMDAHSTNPARQPTNPQRLTSLPWVLGPQSADKGRAAPRAPMQNRPSIGSRFFGERYMSTIWFRKNN
jgi:hypothetical protein